jgi:hypothetical protein
MRPHANNDGESGRGDGISPVTPPTPPGMRLRTGRFQSDHVAVTFVSAP